ncbi:alpha/beta hydrolase [Glycomyces sp. NPDC047010]|uniref:alpha/beta fold hydrolase n=1 Tax=Glycomyces sp. NPDC047010 TaxID=3155023 RepID=UPI0033F80C32
MTTPQTSAETEAGPADGEPVVFVPGATLPKFVWEDAAETLARHGFRTVRYDLLGRDAAAAPRTRYDAALFDRQLDALLDHLSPDRPVHLVSLAFGALIAAGFAARRPQRVRSLVHVAPDGFGVRLPLRSRLLLLPVAGDLLARAAGPRALLSRLADYSDRPEIVAALRERFRPHATPALTRAVLSSVRHMPIHDAAEQYRAVADVPTLVLWGRGDRVTPLPSPERLEAAFPNARITVLEDCGHLPDLERPGRVAAHLLPFLREHADPGTPQRGSIPG